MSMRLATKCVVAVAMCFLMGMTASAQWSGPVVVTNQVEPFSNLGQNRGGVSAARCGSNVVVGFGDSEAGNNNSFAGYAVSSDGGTTFVDGGVLPNTPGNGLGDGGFGPDSNGNTVDHQLSVACGGQRQFYYAATLTETNQFQACPAEEGICSSISVSVSSDGGQSWGMPSVVDRRDIDNHQLSSPSVAVDPTSPRVYVAYLDQNGSPFDYNFADCQDAPITVLRLAVSVSFGATWTSTVVDHACGFSSNPENSGTLAAPTVVVSPGGKVYLAYEHQGTGFNGPPPPNEIRFTRSVDQGKTFSPSFTVSKTAIDNALPRLAVDRTTSAFRGAIYLTWSGMPRGTTTEVLMADSLNQGVSFSFPRSVRSTSVGTQVNPVVAVDNDGDVATCYYVTGTNTPTSTSSYFYNCLTSANHAATWASYQKLAASAPPGFDALTSDFLLLNDGFFTAFELQSSTGQRSVVGSRSDNP